MTFSQALEAVKQGHAIQRSGWNGSGLTVKAQFPDDHSKMTQPYLYIEYPPDHKVTPGARCPWLASQTDIMADDWSVKVKGAYSVTETDTLLEIAFAQHAFSIGLYAAKQSDDCDVCVNDQGQLNTKQGYVVALVRGDKSALNWQTFSEFCRKSEVVQ